MALSDYERLSVMYDEGWGGFAQQYVEMLLRLLGEHGIRAARVLDLACGTGELALALADCGHTVLGVDLSPGMIKAARAKVGDRKNVCYDIQDMTRLTVDGHFDLVTCTFDSLNYLTNPADVQAVFQGVAGLLQPDGLFVFDSNTHQLYAARHKGTYHRVIGEYAFHQKLHYDVEKREVTTVFAFHDGVEEIHRQRPYELEEVEEFLAHAGLRVLHTYSRLNGAPFEAGSERLICVAGK